MAILVAVSFAGLASRHSFTFCARPDHSLVKLLAIYICAVGFDDRPEAPGGG